MSKQGEKSGRSRQLSFDLSNSKTAPVLPSKVSPANKSNVARFVDSSTLAVRRQAIARVKAAGIFPAPRPRSK
jgi:hypothetical protein